MFDLMFKKCLGAFPKNSLASRALSKTLARGCITRGQALCSVKMTLKNVNRFLEVKMTCLVRMMFI